MLQKLACHMAIIKNSGSNCTFVCIKIKSYIYVSPLYIYSSYPPFRCHCQCLWRSLAFFFDCIGDPHRWTRGIGRISGDCKKTKICKLVYQPIKILCTFVQIPNQYSIFTYCTWVSNGGSWCLTSNDSYWVLFKHHLRTIKMHKKYIYANVNKSMSARKTYLHVQIKIYYLEGQWIFQRNRDIHVH